MVRWLAENPVLKSVFNDLKNGSINKEEITKAIGLIRVSNPNQDNLRYIHSTLMELNQKKSSPDVDEYIQQIADAAFLVYSNVG